MRIIHTSDWHLGHTLHGHDRGYEHRAFLSWLLEVCVQHSVDALIVAGDIFDAANPPASAQAMYYQFLADLRKACPTIDILVVGGNHDSALRLDAPLPLFSALNVHVVGGLAKKPDGHLDLERLCIPLTNSQGEIGAWCAALPYLRPADLPRIQDPEVDALIEGVRARYQQVLDAARAKKQPHQALIATGHCYMAHTQLSELSERKVLRGNQHALPADLFPQDLAYVALGHLHRPQHVGNRQELRYSGSPIPLSMAEQHYPHQVVLLTLDQDRVVDQEPLLVPRSVSLMRLPKPDAAAPWAEIKPLLEALPEKTQHQALETLAYLEVQVLLDKPQPNLRQKVTEVLENKAVRLVKLATQYAGSGKRLADSAPEIGLQDLQPEDVFARKYASEHGGEPSEALRNAFFELLEHVENGANA